MFRYFLAGVVASAIVSLFPWQPREVHAEDPTCELNEECRAICTSTDGISITATPCLSMMDGSCWCDDLPDCEESKDCWPCFSVSITVPAGESHGLFSKPGNPCKTGTYTFGVVQPYTGLSPGCQAWWQDGLNVYTTDNCNGTGKLELIEVECDRTGLTPCGQRNC